MPVPRQKEVLSGFLSRKRTRLLKSTDKYDAVKELVAAVCEERPALDPQQVLDTVWERENNLSTHMVPGIAIPHARIDGLGQTLMAVGKSRQGIAWDTDENEPVQLVILIIGTANEHLRVLSRIAARIANEEVHREMLATADPQRLFELLTLPYPAPDKHTASDLNALSKCCFLHAVETAREIRASALILHADAVGSIAFLEKIAFPDMRLFIITRDPSRYPAHPGATQCIAVPFGGTNRSNQIDVALLFLISQGLLARTDRVVSICGLPESGTLDTIMATELKHEKHLFLPDGSHAALPADIEPQVLSRILQVATNLAGEGREGKPVGTLFVIGDYEHVKPLCRQMVINPFKGYHEEDRNILDPGLEETIKEFSRIDGAFVLRGDGVIESAGTYIRANADIGDLTPGLGARHAAAASVTRESNALSVALSESTRKISLYRNGQQLLEL